MNEGIVNSSLPLVSIIIPFRNTEVMLEKCLQSCLEQNYPSVEIIAVDNLSTDGSLAIVERIALQSQMPIRVVNCSSRGANNARPMGFSVARGQYIQWLDADDTLHPEKIASQVAALEANKEYDVAYGNASLRFYKTGLSEFHDQKLIVQQYDDPILQLLEDMWVPCMAFLYRYKVAKLLHQIRAWNPYAQLYDDPEYAICAAVLAGRFLHTPDSWSFYSQWAVEQISRKVDPTLARRGEERLLLRMSRLFHQSGTASRLTSLHRSLLKVRKTGLLSFLIEKPVLWFNNPETSLVQTPSGVRLTTAIASAFIQLLRQAVERPREWRVCTIIGATAVVWEEISFLCWCVEQEIYPTAESRQRFDSSTSIYPYRSPGAEAGSNAQVMLMLQTLHEWGLLTDACSDEVGTCSAGLTVIEGRKDMDQKFTNSSNEIAAIEPAAKTNVVTSILVIGSGCLHDSIGRRLKRLAPTRLDSLVATGNSSKVDCMSPDDVQSRVLSLLELYQSDLVVCVAEGLSLDHFRTVNAALVRSNTRAIFAASTKSGVVIGPTFTPGPSSCFECSGVPNYLDRGGQMTLKISDTSSIFEIVEYVATELYFEVQRVCRGEKPWFNEGSLYISADGERTFSPTIRTSCCKVCGMEANSGSYFTSSLLNEKPARA